MPQAGTEIKRTITYAVVTETVFSETLLSAPGTTQVKAAETSAADSVIVSASCSRVALYSIFKYSSKQRAYAAECLEEPFQR